MVNSYLQASSSRVTPYPKLPPVLASVLKFLVAVVATALTLLCLLGGPVSVVLDYDLALHGKPVSGKVVEVSRTISKSGATVYRSHVSYVADQEEYLAIVSSGVSQPKPEHTVFYSPLWPAYAELDSRPPPPSKSGVILKLSLCLLFGICGLAALKRTLV